MSCCCWLVMKMSTQEIGQCLGFGTQIEIDSPEIRLALLKGTSDEDSEIRGEALVGLANRKDSSAIELLLNEWKNFEDVSVFECRSR